MKKTVILFTVTTFLIVIIINCYIDNILFKNDEVILLPKKTMVHSGRQKTLLCNTFNCLWSFKLIAAFVTCIYLFFWVQIEILKTRIFQCVLNADTLQLLLHIFIAVNISHCLLPPTDMRDGMTKLTKY